LYWPSLSAQGVLSAEGRCLTFDASAAGYVRGDACGSVAMRLTQTEVDGQARLSWTTPSARDRSRVPR